MKARRLLKSFWSATFFALGRLGRQDHVGEIGHQVVALGVAGQRLELLVLADVLLGHRQIALVDFDAVDLGDHRIALRPRRAGRQHREQRGGDQAERARAQGGEPRPRRSRGGCRSWAGMAILVVLCAAKIGGGRRLVAQSVRLGNDRMGRLLDDAVIANAAEFERRRPKTALIDKAWTPSYVSNAARSCSMLAIPLQIAREVPHFPMDGRIGGLPQARN